MRLAYSGREYIVWEIEDAPSGVLQVTFDGGFTWWNTIRLSQTEIRALVAGPGAVANPLNTIVLPVGFYGIFLRLWDGVEDVYRPAGHLLVDNDIGF